TSMRRAIGANEAGAIHYETNGQLLNGDVMDNLIVSTLQECRINRDKWLVALGRQSRGKCHSMLLRNSDVEGTLWIGLGENIDAGAARHCGRDRHNAVVLCGLFNKTFAEYFRVGRRVRSSLVLFV